MDCIHEITTRLGEKLSPTHLNIVDESHLHIGHVGAEDGAKHLAITVISDKFIGIPTIQKHRMIYDLIGDLIPSKIHALSINTPSEVQE